jgi:phosphoribosyl-ATP pyrophosphohydrolase
MAKTIKKAAAKAPATDKPATKKAVAKAAVAEKAVAKKAVAVSKKTISKKLVRAMLPASLTQPSTATPENSGVEVMDRLFATIASRKGADPAVSHSARLLSRGTAKVAQKFGEEAVECLIEAVAGNKRALIAESADVLYHLLVLWVDADVQAHEVWGELERRQGVSGIAEKAARAQKLSMAFGLGTSKIP